MRRRINRLRFRIICLHGLYTCFHIVVAVEWMYIFPLRPHPHLISLENIGFCYMNPVEQSKAEGSEVNLRIFFLFVSFHTLH